jgi:hypothetical protein
MKYIFYPLILFLIFQLTTCFHNDLWDIAQGTEPVFDPDSFGTGSEYDYNEDYPLLGVYYGQSTIFDSNTHECFMEFSEGSTKTSGTLYFYSVMMNWLLEMDYEYDSNQRKITFTEIKRYSSFGNDAEFYHAPFDAISEYTDVIIDKNGFTCNHYPIGEEESEKPAAVQISMSRVKRTFPSSRQNGSTTINITINSSLLANRSVLAFASSSLFGDNNSSDGGGGLPDAGCGFTTIDASGSGSLTIYTADSLFQSDSTPEITVMVGDINTSGYWFTGSSDFPFLTYAGYPDEMISEYGEQKSYSILEKGTYSFTVTQVSSIEDFDTGSEDYESN